MSFEPGMRAWYACPKFLFRDQQQKNSEQLIEKIIGKLNMKSLFEIFVLPEVKTIQNHRMVVALVLVVAANHMVVVVVDMGVHMEMIMVLNRVIVRNLQMVMGRVNITHIIIITMDMMIGTVFTHSL